MWDRFVIEKDKVCVRFVSSAVSQGPDFIFKKAIGRDWKGLLSPVLYVVAIIATLRFSWIAQAMFVIAALIWLISDRRIEKRLAL
ncbi:hypothetical protein [Edaphobacter bradus]|uniref:hypothetical protein n=1 Tax=Edaphobacter bradus TaxID=2259016 RepID=UPI0021DF6286|nr:hypothetical protein [Edaphobacter bradus]